MYSFKNQKGVTMVALAITIILILILAGISMNYGLTNIDSATDSKYKSELGMVQHAVLEQYTKYKITEDELYLVGNKISDSEVRNIIDGTGITLVTIPDTYKNKDYHKLDKASLASLGIRDSTDEYIVNYVSGEVINITHKILSTGEPLYTKADSF